jgi:phosphatidylglycerol:prolipoprotein diacylglycerol transferase
VLAIPWFTLPPIDLDGIGLGKLHWFAIFVLAGIVLGVVFYDRSITRGGDIDWKVARAMPEAAVIGGFVGAHLVHVLLYHPELMREDPLVLLKFWAGISSIGGFFGGALACIAVLLYYRQRLLPYGDRLMVALAIGWAFGRLGCATSHDHPGALSNFALAVQFHDGARHDLGLYEFLYTALLLVPALLWLSRRPFRTGALLATTLLSYAPVRFVLDFLRATDRDFVDRRYLGLTPAQYGTLFMFGAGLAVAVLAWRRKWALQPPLWGPAARPATGAPVLAVDPIAPARAAPASAAPGPRSEDLEP